MKFALTLPYTSLVLRGMGKDFLLNKLQILIMGHLSVTKVNNMNALHA